MQYQQQREPFGKRAGRFLTLCIILVFICLSVIAYLRFSTETLALITGGGMVCGACVVLMLFGLGVYYIKQRTEVLRPPAPPQYPAYQMPQLVIQAPPAQPALPNYGGPYEGYYGGNQSGWGFEQPGRDGGRAWEIIGGEE